MDSTALFARLAEYLGAALLFGWPAFSRVVAASPPPRVVTGIGALLLVGGALAVLWTQTAIMTGADAVALDPADIRLVLGETVFGHGVAVRLGLAVLLLAGLALRAPDGVVLAMGAAATASMALTGHATDGEGVQGILRQVADAAHMLAAAVWVGALAALAGAAFNAGDSCEIGRTARFLSRFSGLGTLVVATLALTGLLNGAALVTPAGIPHLTETDYGRLLLAKLTAFAAMLGLAATNRFLLTPRLLRGRSALAAIRISLAAELALGLAVFALVAALGQLPPVAETLAAP